MMSSVARFPQRVNIQKLLFLSKKLRILFQALSFLIYVENSIRKNVNPELWTFYTSGYGVLGTPTFTKKKENKNNRLSLRVYICCCVLLYFSALIARRIKFYLRFYEK